MATTNFEVNGLIDTSDTVLNNINKIATAAGSFVTWDPSAGAWSVIPNATGTSVKSFDNNNIIGNINVSGSGITELYNSVSIEFPHRDLRDSLDYIELEIPQSQRFPQELDNRLEIRTDCVNDPVQAEYIAARELKQSRVDKIVEFRTDYTANGLVAGDLISITSTMYGYVNKLFRIITIEEDDSDGTILYSINGLEYDPSVYDTSGLTRKQRSKETQITPKCANEAVNADENENSLKVSLTQAAIAAGLALYFNRDNLEYQIDFRGTQAEVPVSGGAVQNVGAIINWVFADGQDLDIRCRVYSPFMGQSSVDDYVGWTGEPVATNSTSVWPPANVGPAVIEWAGDNTGTGFESVRVDIGAFLNYFPYERYLVVECRGNWYVEPGARPIELEGFLFAGGTYSITNFEWKNSGASVSRYIKGPQSFVDSNTDDPQVEGDLISYFVFDTHTGAGQFTKNLGGLTL